MKRIGILFFFLFLIQNSYAQQIDFEIVAIDTAKHFAYSQLTESDFEDNLVIDNDSLYNLVFRRANLKVIKPRFDRFILVKRTIRGNCLEKITQSVELGADKKTIVWNADITEGNCEQEEVRQIVIKVPITDSGYKVKFKEKRNQSGNTGIQEAYQVRSVNGTEGYKPLTSLICLETSLAGVNNNFWDKLIVDSKEDFDFILSNCEEKPESPDFEKEVIVANTYFGDCHMQVVPHFIYDPVTDMLILNAYNIWGGCRAGGRQSIVFKVPKPNPETKVILQEILAEKETLPAHLKEVFDEN